MSTQAKESAPEAAPSRPKRKVARKAKPASAEKKKGNKKKGKGPGKYSQLVIDAIKTLGERNGSSLFKIYHEAKKTSWFDQQHGRVYLRYSIRALLQNDTLVQVKGLGANGSFKMNKKTILTDTKKSSARPKKTAKKPAEKGERKKRSVSGVKKASRTSRAKNIKPKKEDKKTTVEGRKTNKTKKDKQS